MFCRYSIGKWYLKFGMRKLPTETLPSVIFRRYSVGKWYLLAPTHCAKITYGTLMLVIFIGIPSVNDSKNVEKIIRLVPSIFRR